MFNYLRISFITLLFGTILFGGIYPLTITLINQNIFPKQSDGSLIIKDQKVIGSELIGQNFTDEKYFWGRLSATSDSPYNAAASSGSNLSVNNKTLLDNVSARIMALRKFDPENSKLIPVDLVTASASGLDPDISPAAAYYQAPRIAKVRGVNENLVNDLISKNIIKRQFGILGEERVNVLQLNLELDKIK